MATSPSNKKDGSTYLLKAFSKEQLVDRCVEQGTRILNLEEDNKKLISENLSLKKTISNLTRRLDRITTDDFTIKKVLELRAKNYSTVTIKEKLKLQEIDLDIQKIKDIINSELSPDLELYYSECKKKYEESININTNYYKQSSIDEIQRLIDSAYEDLENCDFEDIKQRSALRDSIGSLIAKRDNLMKNIDESGELTEEETYVNETVDSFKETSNKIIKFVNPNIKVIGG